MFSFQPEPMPVGAALQMGELRQHASLLETVMAGTITATALHSRFADEMWSSLARPRVEATAASTRDSKAAVTSVSFHPECFFQRSTCPLQKILFNLNKQSCRGGSDKSLAALRQRLRQLSKPRRA